MHKGSILKCGVVAVLALRATVGLAQESGIVAPAARAVQQPAGEEARSYSRFIDNASGSTADDVVRYAFDHNGELGAARQMVAEAAGRLHQAGVKPNPMVESSYQKAVTSADNSLTVGAELPLELGGRRAARIAVALQELELRKEEVADFERRLAADVRTKYADGVAAARNLKLSEDALRLDRDVYRLVVARVQLGKTAPLEQNTLLVELNRIRALRVQALSKAELAIFDLKKLIQMPSDQVLRLRDELEDHYRPPAQQEAVKEALSSRPDLAAAIAEEKLAQAQVEQVRVEGKVDASIFANYQRMNFGFNIRGFDSQGGLAPVTGIFHYATFGIRLTLPVRNKNQGLIEAAVASAEGAHEKRQFAEIAVRNDVASAYVRLDRATEALGMYKNGVLSQADDNLDVIRQAYLLGQRSMLDYSTEMRRYVDIEMGYTDVLKEYLESRVDVRRAVGDSSIH